MSLHSCTDFCTVATCEALEARIAQLENQLQLLEAAFNAHVAQNIPEAHDYPDQEVAVNITPQQGYSFNITVSVGSQSGSGSFAIPEPGTLPVSVDVSSTSDDVYTLSVSVGDQSDNANLEISHPSFPDFPEIPEPVPPVVNVGVTSVADDSYQITVIVDGQSSNALLHISHPDFPEIPEIPEPDPYVPNISGNATINNGVLTITVSEGNSSDTFSVALPPAGDGDVIINEITEMDCTGLDQKIDDCCNQILGTLNNLGNQLTNISYTLQQDIDQVYEEVTVDITDTINTEYVCEQEKDADGNIISDELVPSSTELDFLGSGIPGIYALLAIMNQNLDALFLASCRDSLGSEVVSLVASDKYVSNILGKVLVLHFVTDDNYPKRSANSTYWQSQIPGAFATYDWDSDFENLRFSRGNQYAELRFNEYKNTVSGWFLDEDAANSYFTEVLKLTNGTKKNIVIPKHSDPLTNVTPRIVRPYRAFVESVNSDGQAICEVKYYPLVNNAS